MEGVCNQSIWEFVLYSFLGWIAGIYLQHFFDK